MVATGEDGVPEIAERAVEVGISDGFETEIISGLAEGEVVVVEDDSSSLEEETGFFFSN